MLRYLDRERPQLTARYPDFERFDAGFAVSPAMMSELAEMAAAQGIEPAGDEAAQSDGLLKLQIKALVAERLFPARRLLSGDECGRRIDVPARGRTARGMVGTGKTYPFEKKISEFRKIRLDIPDIFIIFVYRAIHNRRNSIGAHPAGAGYDS